MLLISFEQIYFEELDTQVRNEKERIRFLDCSMSSTGMANGFLREGI
jgi:hypothetical protein